MDHPPARRRRRIPPDLSVRSDRISDHHPGRCGAGGSGAPVENHPEEVLDGADVNIIPATQVRVGTAPSDLGAILHLTTAERLALAVELPFGVLDEVIEQLQRVRQAISSTGAARRLLH